MARWVVELEPGVYLATGRGDPARTLSVENARVFTSNADACSALFRARKYRAFEWATVKLIGGSAEGNLAENSA